jgi:excisionase family DNA binding protein
MADEILLVEDVAKLLSSSRSSIQERCARGLIPNRRMPGSRRLLISRADLDAWLDGAELETIALAAGGRVVRPIAKASPAKAA